MVRAPHKRVTAALTVALSCSVGGFTFFGGLLRWCAPLSQHAFVVFPDYEYTPKPATGDVSTWAACSTEWVSYAGQQRELLYIDGDNISYAGTFFCHAGPRAVKLADVGETVDEVSVAIRTIRLLVLTSSISARPCMSISRVGRSCSTMSSRRVAPV